MEVVGSNVPMEMEAVVMMDTTVVGGGEVRSGRGGKDGHHDSSGVLEMVPKI